MAFSHSSDNGQLSINGIRFMDPWIHTLGLHKFFVGGSPRGENAQVDGMPGEVPEAWTWDTTDYDLEVIVSGDLDPTGGAYSNAVQGMTSNLNYLRTYLWYPHTKWATTVTQPGSGTLTGDVQVRAFDAGDFGPSHVRVSMTVRVVDGILS